MHVVFLDVTNVFGSAHVISFGVLLISIVPGSIVNIVKAYFQDVQMCFSTVAFTTAWQWIEMGIMTGCTISLLAFTMAMGLVVGGERWQDGLRFPPIRAYIDDMTLVTSIIACTRRLLEKINDNLKWARLKIW